MSQQLGWTLLVPTEINHIFPKIFALKTLRIRILPQAIRVSVGVEADVEASVQEHWLVWGPWKGRGFTGFFPIGIAIIGVWVFWVCCQVAKCLQRRTRGFRACKMKLWEFGLLKMSIGIEHGIWGLCWCFFLCFVGAWLCKTSPKKWLKTQIHGFF